VKKLIAIVAALIASQAASAGLTLKVNDGKGWQEVKTAEMLVANNSQGLSRPDTSQVAKLEITGGVEVEVSADRDISSYRIRPLSRQIKATQEGRKLRFRLERPMYISVEINGDIYHNLQIFADAPLSKPKKRGKKTIFFGPGDHQIEGDSLIVKSGQTVYIDKDATIHGWIAIDDATDVSIIGHGTVLPRGRHEGIMVRRSRRVLIDGPLTTQIPVGASDSVEVRNAKCISSYSWGDGMNVFASSNVSYRNVFCRTSDDCSTIYCTRKSYRGGCRNISVEGATYWADVAHPIMIGLHGDITQNERIENVTYRDIDILEQNEPQIDYQGCIAINDGDNIMVNNLLFDDIRIENLRRGMLFNFRVCFNKKYCSAPGRGIHNVTLRNITYDGDLPNMSIITGYDDERSVSGITFENLKINGQVITDDMKGKPKWYKTADMAHCFIGEHTTDIVYKK